MARYETTIHTPWSPDRAFEYMSDLRHFADWDPGVKRAVQILGQSPGLGSTYDVTVASPGRDLTLRYETVAFDAPRRIKVRAQSRTLVSVDVVTVAPHAPDDPGGAAGSVVTYTAELSLRGLLGIASPLLALAFNRIGDRAARGLRIALEGAAL
ncbi:MAG: SRPBCC family protein [Acidimicrobiia bacterium]